MAGDQSRNSGNPYQTEEQRNQAHTTRRDHCRYRQYFDRRSRSDNRINNRKHTPWSTRLDGGSRTS
ncbi:MAG: hypothetical protein ABI667_08395, partial [Sphingomicrobium sp.]